ncbi:MAG: DUF357 domain-containing protein [DPANN group archaeon]|nr:DUF357 domain-containing protein [DPANN group archaeon]
MDIKASAEKEIKRMQEIFGKVEVNNADKSKEFYDFAKTYFEDGKYFLKKEKFIEAFEAAVIAWAYLDAGLKLGFFSVPKDAKKFFTSGE